MLLGLAHQPPGVLESGLGIMDGAGAHDHEEPVIDAVHDGTDFVPAAPHDLGHAGFQRQFRHQVLRAGQRRELTDAQVRGGVLGVGGCFDAHVRVLFRMRSGP